MNNVDFTVKDKLGAGTYNVFFVIQNIPIPTTYLGEHNKLQQLAILIPTDGDEESGRHFCEKQENTAKSETANPAEQKKANGTPPAQPVPPAKKDESKKGESKK